MLGTDSDWRVAFKNCCRKNRARTFSLSPLFLDNLATALLHPRCRLSRQHAPPTRLNEHLAARYRRHPFRQGEPPIRSGDPIEEHLVHL